MIDIINKKILKYFIHIIKLEIFSIKILNYFVIYEIKDFK